MRAEGAGEEAELCAWEAGRGLRAGPLDCDAQGRKAQVPCGLGVSELPEACQAHVRMRRPLYVPIFTRSLPRGHLSLQLACVPSRRITFLPPVPDSWFPENGNSVDSKPRVQRLPHAMCSPRAPHASARAAIPATRLGGCFWHPHFIGRKMETQ